MQSQARCLHHTVPFSLCSNDGVLLWAQRQPEWQMFLELSWYQTCTKQIIPFPCKFRWADPVVAVFSAFFLPVVSNFLPVVRFYFPLFLSIVSLSGLSLIWERNLWQSCFASFCSSKMIKQALCRITGWNVSIAVRGPFINLPIPLVSCLFPKKFRVLFMHGVMKTMIINIWVASFNRNVHKVLYKAKEMSYPTLSSQQFHEVVKSENTRPWKREGVHPISFPQPEFKVGSFQDKAAILHMLSQE